ncbi:DNA/RNA non-specific endonuclease [Roseomonas elaeocarpi]|uniref:Endonuclease n=1 Tax=Roseomonas elaeocarpi TaxID=907779 RepID=A0ABV6JPV0_9PROT
MILARSAPALTGRRSPGPRRSWPARLAATLMPVPLLSALLLLPAAPATAAPAACAAQYPGGTGPAIERASLRDRVEELCFGGFALLHSGVSRTPLAVSEHLTRARIRQAGQVPRDDRFHAEDALPDEDQSRLSDYARSGFDRGHMAPSGDMATAASQGESFSLANIVPQNPGSNRCLWEGVESTVRSLATEQNEVWVVTGPVFEGESLQRLNNRVLVPTSLFKAVWVPSLNGAAAYLAPNAPGVRWRAVSIEELRRITGIDVFPTLPAALRGTALALPDPRPSNIRESCYSNGNNGEVAQADNAPPPAAGRAAAPPEARRSPVEERRVDRPRNERGSPQVQPAASSRLTLILAAVFAIVAVVALIRVLGRR